MAEYDLGDMVVLKAQDFTNDAGAPTDPTTVKLEVRKPDGTKTTYTYDGTNNIIVKDATGRYHKDITPDMSGRWYYRWVGTGTVQQAAWTEFTVLRSPT